MKYVEGFVYFDFWCIKMESEHVIYVMKDGSRICGTYHIGEDNQEAYIIIRVERRVQYDSLGIYNPVIGLDTRMDDNEQIRTDKYCSVSFRYGLISEHYEMLEDRTEGYYESETMLLFHFVYHHLNEYVTAVQNFKQLDDLYEYYGNGTMCESIPQKAIGDLIRRKEMECMALSDT